MFPSFTPSQSENFFFFSLFISHGSTSSLIFQFTFLWIPCFIASNIKSGAQSLIDRVSRIFGCICYLLKIRKEILENEIFPVKSLYIYSIAQLMCYVKHNHISINISKLFTHVKDMHTYETRSLASENFYTNYSRLNTQKTPSNEWVYVYRIRYHF